MAFAITIVLFILLAVPASQIVVENDVAKLIPGNSSLQEINELQSASGLYDKIIFKLKTDNADADILMAAADSLEQKLNYRLGSYTQELKLKIDETAFWDVQEIVAHHLACFLDTNDYAAFDSLLIPKKMQQRIAQNANLLNTISGVGAKRILANDMLGVSLIPLKKMQSLQVDDRIELMDGYLFTDEQKSVLAFLTLKDSIASKNADEVVANIKEIEADVARVFPSVKLFVYGGLLVANENKQQLQEDTKLTLSITIAGIVLLTLLVFRRKRIPFLMLLPALFGFLFSLAIIRLLQGNISGISLAAGSIVLGIAINYSLHFFTQLSFSNNIKQTVHELWVPLTLGSFTTVASFLALVFLSSPILRDFGLFAGLSLCGAALFTLFLLPQFSPESVNTFQFVKNFRVEVRAKLKTSISTIAFLIVLLLSVVFFTQIHKVKFVSELNEFNYTSAKLKAAEDEILWLQNDTSKTVFVASVASDLQTALQQNEALTAVLEHEQQLNSVEKFASFSAVLPSKSLQEQRIAKWDSYWTIEKKNLLLQNLQTAMQKAGFSEAVFSDFKQRFLNKQNVLDSESQAKLLSVFGSGLVAISNNKAVVFNSVTVDKNQKKFVYDHLQKLSGVVLLDKQIISNALVDVLYSDFNAILSYTIFIVSIALIVGYGRLELAIITFVPMLLSWIWILGIMGFAGIHFNLINIVISTFIFGLGDDFSIFITDGLIGKFKDGKHHLQTHRLGILLCALTTLLGLGVLYFGKHPALKSIAVVSIIGIVSVYIIGQIVQPVLFNYFIQSRSNKGLAPWTLKTLALAVGAFSYFTFGAFLLTFIGFVLLYALPFISKKRRKIWYHFILCNFVKSLVYLMANVRKVHIDKGNMNFSKPAVIVANHSSFLDILVVAMQHPKLILLTNKWVYYSPVFGKVVQLADYYPVMEGVDPAIEKFEKIVADGYSIAVFPEGTRSPDGNLKRFHKGAFFLAEKLNLDIVPMVLHGIHHTMQKGDFMLFDGTMSMKFLPRITPENQTYGNGYAERTKGISKLFKQELTTLKERLETPEYFKQKLVSNYWYKGFSIEQKAKKFMNNADLIKEVHRILPKHGSLAEINSGYSFLTYTLLLFENTRSIVAVEGNNEMRNIAANCYMASKRIVFEQNVDALKQHFDAVVLHGLESINAIHQLNANFYLLIEKQEAQVADIERFEKEFVGVFNKYQLVKFIPA